MTIIIPNKCEMPVDASHPYFKKPENYTIHISKELEHYFSAQSDSFKTKTGTIYKLNKKESMILHTFL